MELTHDSGTLLLEGPLDVRSTGRLRDAIYDQLQSEQSEVVLDMSGVTWVDAVTLRMLAVATRNAERDGRRLRIRGCAPNLRRMLRISRFSPLLDLEPVGADEPLLPRQRGTSG